MCFSFFIGSLFFFETGICLVVVFLHSGTEPFFLCWFLKRSSYTTHRSNVDTADRSFDNEVAEYTEYDLQRLAVKPGITGWWQVTDRNDTDFDGMVRRDLEYIAKRGVATDLKIVLLTVVEVFTGGGAC